MNQNGVKRNRTLDLLGHEAHLVVVEGVDEDVDHVVLPDLLLLPKLHRRPAFSNDNGVSIAQWSASLPLDPPALGLIPSIPEFFLEKNIVNVGEVNQQSCLEKIGQWLENVDQTHLVQARGELVLQKQVRNFFSKGLIFVKTLEMTHFPSRPAINLVSQSHR